MSSWTIIEDLKEKVSALESEQRLLRTMLWFRHGCSGPALYGDDGELQCHACMIDFKRDSIVDIETKFFTLDRMRAEKYFNG